MQEVGEKRNRKSKETNPNMTEDYSLPHLSNDFGFLYVVLVNLKRMLVSPFSAVGAFAY